MPGAAFMIERYYWKCVAGVMAGRTRTRTRAFERATRNHIPDTLPECRAALEVPPGDLRVRAEERMSA